MHPLEVLAFLDYLSLPYFELPHINFFLCDYGLTKHIGICRRHHVLDCLKNTKRCSGRNLLTQIFNLFVMIPTYLSGLLLSRYIPHLMKKLQYSVNWLCAVFRALQKLPMKLAFSSSPSQFLSSILCSLLKCDS